MAKRKYNSFTFYTNQNIMRVVFLAMITGVIGVVGGVFLLYGF